ncbi:hypothetical protein [Sphingomonas sp.]|uniref:hypothetical protein n=1 Tax=Sphingomonas sp. TaxID=28214 RepID=UPI003F729CFE
MGAKFTFGRISDAQVVSLMKSLLGKFTAGTVTVSVGSDEVMSLSKTQEEGLVEEIKDGYEALFQEDSYFITHAHWQVGPRHHRVTYHRSKFVRKNANNADEWQLSPNPYIDGLEYNGPTEHSAVVLGALRAHVDMAPPISAAQEAGSALDQSHAILNRVSQAVASLVEHTSSRQKDLDKTRASLSREAESAVKAAKVEMEKQVAEIREKYDLKERELEEREGQIDDRANTHVRREFATKMAALSDTRLSSNLLSRSQWSYGIPLAIALIPAAIICIFIWLEISYIDGFNRNISQIVRDEIISENKKAALIENINSQILYGQIRIALQSIGLAALVWFSLRLASSRYALVSDWERDLHKFRLDTERAGFLVEGDLEARKVNEVGLPEVLLASFSRNLFVGSDRRDSDQSDGMGEVLSALLGQAARVKLGPDGVNVEVEGKGIQRAKRIIED